MSADEVDEREEFVVELEEFTKALREAIPNGWCLSRNLGFEEMVEGLAKHATKHGDSGPVWPAILHGRDLDTTDIPPPECILHMSDGGGLFQRGTVALLAALGGSGKTRMLHRLAGVAACGRGDWLPGASVNEGQSVARHRVHLVLGEEDENEVRRHLRRIEVAFPGCRPHLSWQSLIGQHGMTLADEKAPGATAALAKLVELVETERVELLILDPLVSFFRGNENDNAVMQGFIEALRVVAACKAKPAVVVAHHSSKTSTGDSQAASRGASSLVDGARLVMALGSHNYDGQAFQCLSVVKSNYTRTGQQWFLKWDEEALDFAPAEEGEIERLKASAVDATLDNIAAAAALKAEKMKAAKARLANGKGKGKPDTRTPDEIFADCEVDE